MTAPLCLPVADDLPLRIRITEAQALAIINALPEGDGVAHAPAFEPTLAEVDGVTVGAIEHALRKPGCVGLSRLLERDAFVAALASKVRGVGLTIRWSEVENGWFMSVPPAPMNRHQTFRRAA